MSRDPRYQRLLNSKRWWEVKRIVWQRAGGLCEECKQHGFVTAGVDCHHIQPIEKSMSVAEMERLCYDPNNIRLVCIPCHQRIHRELNSHKTDTIKQRRTMAQSRWVDAMRSKFLRRNDDEGEPKADTMTADGM